MTTDQSPQFDAAKSSLNRPPNATSMPSTRQRCGATCGACHPATAAGAGAHSVNEQPGSARGCCEKDDAARDAGVREHAAGLEGGESFPNFVDEIHTCLQPRGGLAAVVVDFVIVEAWRLRKLVDPMLEACALFDAVSPKKLSATTSKQAREALQAIASGLEILANPSLHGTSCAAGARAEHAAQVDRPPTPQPPSVDLYMELDPLDDDFGASADSFGPRSPFLRADDSSDFREPSRYNLDDEYDAFEPFDDDDADDCDEPPIWSGRLTFDSKVSDYSPVVRGTWVTAGQIVTLIVDGWTWAEILRSHPELTDDDIRACLAYVIEQDAGDDVI